ncbi:hypothetical protein QFC22_004599 [Naganishia vaughanmartiniae]|uniref:Uncharacterized protein n=1 Tax=Naganishia vaughanmartiniae TaxID=1424756 RepID=A0ACC2X0L2_9TREE|nr:hypothetical protein QFC22_004599 [Naganishia vaughanmartiniae]
MDGIFTGAAPPFWDMDGWQMMLQGSNTEGLTIYAPHFKGATTASALEAEEEDEDEEDDQQPLTEEQLPRLVRLKLPALKSPHSTGALEEWLCMIPPVSILHPPPPPPVPRATVNDTLSSTTASERNNKEKRDRELAAAKRATEASALDPLQECLDALEHLRGGCLTHRAGWFTYA